MAVNSDPRFVRYLLDQHVLRNRPFSLVDVGASGGIEQHWRHFGDSLQAVGFDPLIKEVERLNATELNPNVHYVASLVGCREIAKQELNNVFSTDPHCRTSSVRAWELLNCNYPATYYDQTHDGSASSDLIELDEYLEQNPSDVDFIKVDTDGDDLAVLLGASRLLSGTGPIALAVETLLVGCRLPSSNLFANVDNYLQGLGYSLFSFEPRLHTRAALPKSFRGGQPGDTFAGQARWADTIFCRDVCIPGYEAHFDVTLTPEKLLKLCGVFEIFCLEDCAAEVLINFRERVETLIDVDYCLDLLTPPLPDGSRLPYREYIEFFEKHVETFYSGTGTLAELEAAKEHLGHQQQIVRLEEQLALKDDENRKLRILLQEANVPHLQAQLKNSELECAELRYSIESSLALKLARSLPRIPAPLRALFRKRP
ncbi:MAG: hypothetical protein JWP63_7210 [Candidatus Solibacter sp.]|nr:hypothetical protein [Candidatus Solibacter sp.]